MGALLLGWVVCPGCKSNRYEQLLADGGVPSPLGGSGATKAGQGASGREESGTGGTTTSAGEGGAESGSGGSGGAVARLADETWVRALWRVLYLRFTMCGPTVVLSKEGALCLRGAKVGATCDVVLGAGRA